MCLLDLVRSLDPKKFEPIVALRTEFPIRQQIEKVCKVIIVSRERVCAIRSKASRSRKARAIENFVVVVIRCSIWGIGIIPRPVTGKRLISYI